MCLCVCTYIHIQISQNPINIICEYISKIHIHHHHTIAPPQRRRRRVIYIYMCKRSDRSSSSAVARQRVIIILLLLYGNNLNPFLLCYVRIHITLFSIHKIHTMHIYTVGKWAVLRVGGFYHIYTHLFLPQYTRICRHIHTYLY